VRARDEGVAEVRREELRPEPLERDERRGAGRRDRPAARAARAVEEREERVARREPERVREP
jgi:hypothetical protein